MQALGLILLVPVLFVLAIALRGWCVSMMWNWFITPLGAPAVTVLMGFGISMCIGLFTRMRNDAEKAAHPDTKMEKVVNFLFKDLIIVVVGWIVHSLM